LHTLKVLNSIRRQILSTNCKITTSSFQKFLKKTTPISFSRQTQARVILVTQSPQNHVLLSFLSKPCLWVTRFSELQCVYESDGFEHYHAGNREPKVLMLHRVVHTNRYVQQHKNSGVHEQWLVLDVSQTCGHFFKHQVHLDCHKNTQREKHGERDNKNEHVRRLRSDEALSWTACEV